MLPQSPEDVFDSFVDVARPRGARQRARDDGVHGRRPSVEQHRERRDILYDKMTDRSIVH
jgi:hypothetical protein